MFTPSDFIPDDAERVWQHYLISTFSAVRKEVDYHIEEYQNHAAERINTERGFESPDHYVESSDFLSVMDAQARVGHELAVLLKLDRPDTMVAACATLESFAQVWKDRYLGSDGSGEGIITEAMQDGIARLLPLMLIVARASP